MTEGTPKITHEERVRSAQDGVLGYASMYEDFFRMPQTKSVLLQMQSFTKHRNLVKASSSLSQYIGDPNDIYIDFHDAKVEFSLPYVTANIAAFCTFLNGKSLPKNDFSAKAIADTVLSDLNLNNKQDLNAVMATLGIADLTRIYHFIDLLGIYPKSPDQTKQICLGTASGGKDLYGFHNHPLVIETPTELTFDFKAQFPQHTILVDNEEKNKRAYDYLARMHPQKLTGMIGDAQQILSNLNLPEAEKRNLVICHRIHPDMVGNPRIFLKNLSEVISDDAYLFISMGAGNTFWEYKARLVALGQIYDLLKTTDHHPVQIKLFEQNAFDWGRSRPYFGNPSFATHMVIFAKLNRHQLHTL